MAACSVGQLSCQGRTPFLGPDISSLLPFPSLLVSFRWVPANFSTSVSWERRVGQPPAPVQVVISEVSIPPLLLTQSGVSPPVLVFGASGLPWLCMYTGHFFWWLPLEKESGLQLSPFMVTLLQFSFFSTCDILLMSVISSFSPWIHWCGVRVTHSNHGVYSSLWRHTPLSSLIFLFFLFFSFPPILQSFLSLFYRYPKWATKMGSSLIPSSFHPIILSPPAPTGLATSQLEKCKGPGCSVKVGLKKIGKEE